MVETFEVYNSNYLTKDFNSFDKAIEYIKTQKGKHQIVKHYEWKEV